MDDVRRFIRACRESWDDRPREIFRTHYALGWRVRMQRPLARKEGLYAVILHMLRQDCGQTAIGRDTLDSWAISAYEQAILTPADVGYLEPESAPGRIGATVTAKGNELDERRDLFERDKRIIEARERLGTISDMTPD